MQDVMRLNGSIVNDLAAEWSFLEKLPVVLHDKLMTDAVLGNRPIKTEHSYSLTSDGDSLPESPISSTRMDVFSDMDDECFNAISASEACGRLSSDEIDIKDEPVSESDSSCSSSPQHSSFLNQDTCSVDAFFNTDVEMKSPPKSILKHRNIMLTAANNNIFTSAKLPNIKTEPGSSFSLPPTPPSCSSSEESEDNITVTSQPSSSAASPATVVVRTKSSTTTARVLLSHYTTRQPIHTPLISSQPKGSTGTLMLTEEEKRTLIAEGYPVPTRLPLTKAEEKSLKKIRRKIKNKISAQESRRKKKEYMDQLERKVELLVTENSDYRKQIDNLEGSNSSLLNQLAKLQAIVARTHPHLVKKN
ncbi:PREDICTED: cyclic AMP response element-binding protein A-like isoform X2 [Nicrophorus vespilloides]|uniref:Cyclic AMP response element-binding protein A-like isoform X2 n=1 Tax=Nicrophorus vespilloides TaxID=110193 RepID=A0ABM1M2B0_NICVS|nr:PREDICTED: cyclic AMP response element-binding protein A-like isoform X2 [Nicrophorus vespilloides]